VRRLTALALLAAPAAIAEAPPATASLDWFEGEWHGTGTLSGRPTTVSLKVSPLFDGKAVASEYHAESPAEGDRPALRFEGRGTYRIGPDGKVTGSWSDSFGNVHPLAGRISGTSLSVNWGEPRSELGFSSYVLGADGTLTVTDGTYNRGEAKVFARASYRRK
jgi:hypothetical protein